MLSRLKDRLKLKPSLYYAMSIAATWANAGSLLNGIATAQKDGVIPYLLWAIGNTLACVVFGIFAPMIPKLRDVFRSKIMQIVMGIMCPFQCWISMNGIQTVFAQTSIGDIGGVVIASSFAIFFTILLFKFGMIRNILTDHISWTIVYIMVFILTIVALIISNDNYIILNIGNEHVDTGIKNCILLIPGAFLYPYYFELLDYNDKNDDNVANINIRKTFILGGLLFGVYLIFIFMMSITNFTPFLNIIKAILVTLVAVSSLSSFQYSIYLTFGRKIGLAVNILTVVLWQFLIPLGVMGAWTLMASLRIYIVALSIIASFIWYLSSKKKQVANKINNQN